MKKLFIAWTFFFLAKNVMAQTEIGKRMVSLSGNFIKNTQTVPFSSLAIDVYNVNARLSLAQFIKTNLAIGLNGRCTYQKLTYNINAIHEEIEMGFQAGIFGQYYHFFSPKVATVLTGNIFYGIQDDPKDGEHIIGLNMIPSFTFFPHKKIGLLLNVGGFNINRVTNKATDAVSVDIDLGFSLTNTTIGMQIHF